MFDALYFWLYVGPLKDIPNTTRIPRADDSYLDDLLLSRIRVFANFRGVPGLDNAAIDMLHERITATAVKIKPCILCVYGNTVMVAEMCQ